MSNGITIIINNITEKDKAEDYTERLPIHSDFVKKILDMLRTKKKVKPKIDFDSAIKKTLYPKVKKVDDGLATVKTGSVPSAVRGVLSKNPNSKELLVNNPFGSDRMKKVMMKLSSS